MDDFAWLEEVSDHSSDDDQEESAPVVAGPSEEPPPAVAGPSGVIARVGRAIVGAFNRLIGNGPIQKEKLLEMNKEFRDDLDNHLSVKAACATCTERVPGMEMRGGNCRRCDTERGKWSRRSRRRIAPEAVDPEFHKFSAENNVIPPVSPPVLKDLLPLEEILIARCSPLLRCTVITRGGQTGNTGHFISFPQDVNELAVSLPR